MKTNEDKMKRERTNGNSDAAIKKVCRFYQQGNCKHGRKGLDCPFDHPKACRKLLKYGNKGTGCKDGSKCINFHPRMCSNSI